MNRLAEIRKAKGLTQEQVAAKAGTTRAYVSEVENGKRRVYTNVLMERLANAIGESVVTVFYSEPDKS